MDRFGAGRCASTSTCSTRSTSRPRGCPGLDNIPGGLSWAQLTDLLAGRGPDRWVPGLEHGHLRPRPGPGRFRGATHHRAGRRGGRPRSARCPTTVGRRYRADGSGRLLSRPGPPVPPARRDDRWSGGRRRLSCGSTLQRQRSVGSSGDGPLRPGVPGSGLLARLGLLLRDRSLLLLRRTVGRLLGRLCGPRSRRPSWPRPAARSPCGRWLRLRPAAGLPPWLRPPWLLPGPPLSSWSLPSSEPLPCLRPPCPQLPWRRRPSAQPPGWRPLGSPLPCS